MSEDRASLALRVHKACCDHADDMLVAAVSLMERGTSFNIAYHLTVLALEEIGKAGLLLARSIGSNRGDTDWIDKRLDDHEQKLLWALWSPLFGSEKMTLEGLQESRHLAKRLHQDRLRSIYVQPPEDDIVFLPKEYIREAQARNLIDLARSRLKIERAHDKPYDDRDELFKWFLETIEDRENLKLVFGKASLQKLRELNRDTRKWIQWLKDQFDESIASAKAEVERELRRSEPTGEAAEQVKWEVDLRMVSASHVIRPKELSQWNRADWLRLTAVDKRRNELRLTVRLRASIPVQGLWEAGYLPARIFLAAINVGSMGYFWFYLPDHADRYYERIVDLEAAPGFELQLREGQPIETLWPRKEVLTAKVLGRVAVSFHWIASLGRDLSNQVMGPYIGGLTFLSKADVHFRFERDAAHQFIKSFLEGLKAFKGWTGDIAELRGVFDSIISDLVKNEPNVSELFELVERFREPSARPKCTTEDALKAKLLCDLLFLKLSQEHAKSIAGTS